MNKIQFKLAKHPDGHFLTCYLKIKIGLKFAEVRLSTFMKGDDANCISKAMEVAWAKKPRTMKEYQEIIIKEITPIVEKYTTIDVRDRAQERRLF